MRVINVTKYTTVSEARYTYVIMRVDERPNHRRRHDPRKETISIHMGSRTLLKCVYQSRLFWSSWQLHPNIEQRSKGWGISLAYTLKHETQNKIRELKIFD